jgi:hypothetical protein
MIRLRYGLMADYAVPGAGGKATIVGVVDAFYTQPPPGEPITITPHTVHLRLEAPSTMGPKHLLELKIVDEDGHIIPIEVADGQMKDGFQMPINFAVRGDGMGLIGYMFFRAEDRIPLPDYGAYQWEVFVDGVRVGEIPFFVQQLTAEARKEFGLPPAVEG